ncbi:hypothetical protein XH83_15115 [Bradyrhizobium sp. CCBAU 53351]|nr:hypothetical protein XH83_15115 [Bradyrhizobium sp. CCBAU 53351]
MKSMIVASAFFVVSAGLTSAHARVVCHHDPVCQAQRDGTSVDQARKREQGVTDCVTAAGYTRADWSAYRVPEGPAKKVRACLARKGLPTT